MKNIRWLLILFILSSPLPALALKLENPLNIAGGDPREIFTRLVGGFAVFTGVLALVFFILGGYRILTAAGNSEHFAKGKTMILYSVVGFVITLSSYYILFQVISILTGKGNLSGFTTSPGLFDPLGLDISNPNMGAMMYGGRILGFLLSGLGGLTLLMFVYGGLQWMLAEGNEEKITKAKKTIMYAILGLAAVLGSYIILKFAYTPFYRLLESPGTPLSGSTAEDYQALNACFTSDGRCQDVNRARCSELGGQFYIGTSCGDIGCCMEDYTCQSSPTYKMQSRVLTSACLPTIFTPCYWGTLPSGSCISPTLNFDDKCYNPVHLVAGKDCSIINN